MASVIRDDMDFSAYEEETEAGAKVLAASKFTADLLDAFKPKDAGTYGPHMSSTKLGERMEFRPGEMTVWAGYNGHRKSMFAGQVALDLCTQKQRVLIASFEMKPTQTLVRMARQCFAVATPASASLEAFGNWTNGKLWLFDHHGRVDSRKLFAVCRYFAEELKGTHIFIDSMMMVVGTEDKLDESKQFITDIVRLAQETGLHVHLIAHCRKPNGGGEERPPSKYDIKGTGAISDQAHNVITVWANKPKFAKQAIDPADLANNAAPDAAVTVEKQRNGEWEGRIQLWFQEGGLRFCDSYTAPVEPYVLTAR